MMDMADIISVITDVMDNHCVDCGGLPPGLAPQVYDDCPECSCEYGENHEEA